MWRRGAGVGGSLWYHWSRFWVFFVELYRGEARSPSLAARLEVLEVRRLEVLGQRKPLNPAPRSPEAAPSARGSAVLSSTWPSS